MRTDYKCVFAFSSSTYIALSNGGIADFKDGFWINEKFEFTKGSDYKYWIPPSKIIYIQKLTIV